MGGAMKTTFRNLPPAQKKKILNSAFQVFTDTSYDLASTNTIVEFANISKGKLFYYFKNKRTLFLYLVEYAVEFVTKAYIEKLVFSDDDFLNRYLKMSQVKRQAHEQEPYLFAFMSYVYLHEMNLLTDELQQKIRDVQAQAQQRLFDGLDMSLFKDDVDAKDVVRILQYSVEGYQEDLIRSLKSKPMLHHDLEPYYKEFNDYIAVLRKLLYK